MLRRLLPSPHGPIDLDGLDALVAAEARPAPPDRPWVFVSMVASVDGATAVDGVSGPLGGEADRVLFSAVRATADIIVVGSATATAERYRRHRPSSAQRDDRAARGQASTARIAVVSSRATIDVGLPMFVEDRDGDGGHERPLVLVAERADPAERARVAAVADVVVAGDERVDLARALVELGRLGAATVLCEGGPTLNGVLLASGLVDEVCLTVAPTLVGGSADRIVVGPDPAHPTDLELVRAWVADDGSLLLRYVRR